MRARSRPIALRVNPNAFSDASLSPRTCQNEPNPGSWSRLGGTFPRFSRPAVITRRLSGNIRTVPLNESTIRSVQEFAATRDSVSGAPSSFAALVEAYSEYVWRTVRRLGVRERDVDDAAQQVLIVAARRLDSIRPGSERAFLFQTALRVAGTQRRTYARRREEMYEPVGDDELIDHQPRSDELLNMRRARQQLDAILDEMPLELRAVFVLHELEEETMADIAVTLGIPAGTAASRLRRARALFYECVARETPRERCMR